MATRSMLIPQRPTRRLAGGDLGGGSVGSDAGEKIAAADRATAKVELGTLLR